MSGLCLCEERYTGGINWHIITRSWDDGEKEIGKKALSIEPKCGNEEEIKRRERVIRVGVTFLPVHLGKMHTPRVVRCSIRDVVALGYCPSSVNVL